jgi:hypothetical protein
MTRREFVVIVTVLAVSCATPLAAQSRGAKGKPPDAITGTWKGEIVPSNAPRGRSVTLELRHDGRGNVSGTVDGMPNPADVKAGSTFDAKTGALKLQLGKADNPEVLLVLEGTVAKNAASGRVSGDVSGEFRLVKGETRQR